MEFVIHNNKPEETKYCYFAIVDNVRQLLFAQIFINRNDCGDISSISV